MNNLIQSAGIPMSSILRKCAKKRCGSVVDCSLVLLSIFGLFALHQESFLFLLLFYFLLLIIYFSWGEVGKKRAVMENVMTVNPVLYRNCVCL